MISGKSGSMESSECLSGEARKRALAEDETSAAAFVGLGYHGEHKRAVSAVSFAAQCRGGEVVARLASASADGTAKVWDVRSAMVDGERASGSKEVGAAQTLVGHARGINDVAWCGGGHVATASDDKTLRLWNVETGDALVEFKGHSNFVFSVRCNAPIHNLLVSGSFDETVKLWDLRSGDCVSTLPAHSDPVTAVDFNRDGTCIVSGSHDGLIRLWDVATGECLKTVYAQANPPVTFVKYSPNGQYVLSGTLDHKLRLWNVAHKFMPSTTHTTDASSSYSTQQRDGGGTCIKTYSGHVNAKYCIFSSFLVSNPHRQSIVTGSEDGSIYIYDLQTRSLRQRINHRHPTNTNEDATILAIAVHPQKEIIASGGGGMTTSDNKCVQFWIPSNGIL